ncbi:MAG: DUF4139 domain-containing protein [Arcicella sp.]|nr:DUF4139 domain-containing protein [Arcicella sp.]
MINKQLLNRGFLFLLCLITNLTFGQIIKGQLADSKIEKVTVFLSGAQVVRSAKISVFSGKTEIRFNHITPDLDVNSVQIKSEGDVAIQSVTHEKDFLGTKPSIAEITKLENQRETIQDKMATDKSLLTVYKREEEMLIKNQLIVGQNTGLKAIDLKESIDFQRLRMTDVLAKQLELDKIIKKSEIEVLKITNQITQITGNKGEETSVIVVAVLANNPTNVNFTLSYFVVNTNWTPSYDLRVKDISKPLNMTFKANINQNSGEDWRDVKLSLSTGEPQKQGNAPVFGTWYIEPVPQVKTMKFLAPEIKHDDEVIKPQANQKYALEEVVVQGYGAVQTNYQQTSKSFDLPQLYTIKTGSKNFQVELKSLDIPATYEYYVAPKYDKDAFLTAKIVDWEKYDLMAGMMKLYFEDTYLGDSYLNVDNQDTLSVSLGRDKGVVVSRNKMTDFRKKQSLGSNKVDSRGYEIVVRNTKHQIINLTIEDQFPISKAKEIEVDNQEANDAEVNKETGIITWKLNLEPNKEKKLKYKFTVKSPKGTVLHLD